MDIKPLRDFVLIKVAPRPTEIVISDRPEPPIHGLVVAAGPEVPRSIQSGDVVLFSYYAGAEVSESKSERLLLVRQADILAKLESKFKEEG